MGGAFFRLTYHAIDSFFFFKYSLWAIFQHEHFSNPLSLFI